MQYDHVALCCRKPAQSSVIANSSNLGRRQCNTNGWRIGHKLFSTVFQSEDGVQSVELPFSIMV